MPFCEQSYLSLSPTFYELQTAQAVSCPTLVIWNQTLADELELEQDVALYAGQHFSESLTPLSQAYAGHQFGNFTMLGDGRAVLLGEAESSSGQRVDVQLKGSGRTRFSRGGDGRAALEPMLREYLMSEAMHALEIPTTRSLAVVGTGESVHREQVLPGAILTRIASSHLRVGTFEYAASFGGKEALQALVDFALARHYPEREGALGFLAGVMERQAALMAKWMSVGFVHGVMNTDNMAISGETIDYGPCAFMDRYDPATVFSSIDQRGRYAYGNQPHIAHWNLAVLAGALVPVVEDEGELRAVLDRFPLLFREHWQREMNAKIGLATVKTGDDLLVNELLDRMLKHKADFTRTFADLDPGKSAVGFETWHAKWVKRLEGEEGVDESMRAHNPVVIPRNHQVEAALNAAGEGDLVPFERLLDLLSDAYNRTRDFGELAELPPEDAPAYRTFCGT